MRPDPAVSVPIAMSARPSATATAEPELDPPEMRSGRRGIRHRAVRASRADQSGGELVEVGFAEYYRAGRPQGRDDWRVCLGR